MATPRTGPTRLVLACVATAAILGPLAWFWEDSLLPGTYAATGMGVVDTGGGPATVHTGQHGHGGRDVTSLRADPDRPADVSVTLTARAQRFTLASGRPFDGYTLNGSSPGPTIRAAAGRLVEVRLVNESVPAGVTLHWHGVDVPNAADGVAGVTQDAVRVGETHTYRFVADRPGTYWYHSHQISHEQVARGLLGALVVDPPAPTPSMMDVVALIHGYGGYRTVNGHEGDLAVEAAPGATARVRVVNADNGPLPVWVAGAPYRLVAIDGTDVVGPAPVTDRAVLLTAGARADLEVTAPARVHLGGPSGVVVGPLGATVRPAPRPAADLDPLGYGTAAPLGFDPEAADRRFRYDIGRRPGFLDGRPGMWWSINGRTYPDLPMFLVGDGDVVRMRITNHSGEAHPMHLHGHHAVVLARDGHPATGSPWWIDSLHVADGETYDVAFVADNPGIWSDHCHNLRHAADGMVVHLMYDGVTTPYLLGGDTGNAPE